jgi:hypothetical protein
MLLLGSGQSYIANVDGKRTEHYEYNEGYYYDNSELNQLKEELFV